MGGAPLHLPLSIQSDFDDYDHIDQADDMTAVAAAAASPQTTDITFWNYNTNITSEKRDLLIRDACLVDMCIFPPLFPSCGSNTWCKEQVLLDDHFPRICSLLTNLQI